MKHIIIATLCIATWGCNSAQQQQIDQTEIQSLRQENSILKEQNKKWETFLNEIKLHTATLNSKVLRLQKENITLQSYIDSIHERESEKIKTGNQKEKQ